MTAARTKADYKPGTQFRVTCSAPAHGRHKMHNYVRRNMDEINWLLATLPKGGFAEGCLPWKVETRETGSWKVVE
jgi:hypothetical protein